MFSLWKPSDRGSDLKKTKAMTKKFGHAKSSRQARKAKRESEMSEINSIKARLAEPVSFVPLVKI